MKNKKLLILLTIILFGICLFCFSNKVNAFTISDDGKYALILNTWDGEIEGQPSKIIKFNFDEGEDTVKVSDLVKGIEPFNGRNEFSHWGKNIFSDEAVKEELKAEDFSSSGTSGDFDYTNGLVIWAKFSEKVLKGTGTYYLTINPFAGKIEGKDTLRLTSKAEEFKTVDLSKYKAVRDGYTFVGWDYNGKFVTSIDSSCFEECDAIEVTAVYIKDSFDGDYVVLNLDANGGKIEGKDNNKYDYVGGRDSGTSMPIFQYVPVREGYTFNGWNTKSDGSGKKYKYMYWGFWRNDGESEFERDTLNDANNMYKTITLYASWTKNSETPTTPEETITSTVKEIKSTGEINAKIEFAEEVSKNYRLDIQKVEIKKELADKNIKFIADINVLEGKEVVKISNMKMKIRIAIPEELKGYSKYEVVYILDDEIKERIPAIVEDGYIVFETSHLSQYGIIATNNEQVSIDEVNNEINNPKTGDNIIISVILFGFSIIAISTLIVINKKKQKSK